MDRLGNVHVAQGFIAGVLVTLVIEIVLWAAVPDVVRMVRHYLVGDTAQLLDEEEQRESPSRAATR